MIYVALLLIAQDILFALLLIGSDTTTDHNINNRPNYVRPETSTTLQERE
jgi:hypothetical protein